MADGGGLGAPVLTADLVARAVIAAALSYGDDPVTAMTATSGARARRCLTAAAGGVQRATDCSSRRMARMLGLHWNSLAVTRNKKPPGFDAAELAAMRAVEYALWEPEAAESAVEDEVEDLAEALPPPAAAPPPPPVGEDLVEPGPLSVRGGAISSTLRPAFDVPAKVTAASPLRDRLLAMLGDGPGCTQGLATLLDAKELLISETLRILQHEGRVVAGEMPPEGRRQQRWRLVGGEA